MEFDNYFLELSLKIWNFNLDDININDIQHVPMHEWRIATKEKPKLYIENLQCCVGLYAYGNKFAFGSHINTLVFNNDEFILDKNKQPIFCNRCIDLVYSILKYRGRIFEPFKIGISIGVTPLDDNEKSMITIYRSINDLIKRLRLLNIPVVLLDNICEPELIIDSSNNNIITPEKVKKIK